MNNTSAKIQMFRLHELGDCFLITFTVGTQNSRMLRRFTPMVQKINGLEPEISRLTDTELQAKTPFFRERLQKGESLEVLLPEAFAVVRGKLRLAPAPAHRRTP